MPRTCVHLMLLVAALMTAPASGQSLFDLDFPGGTLAQYVDAVRDVAHPVNIVARASVVPVRIEPVEFRNVSVDAALRFVEGRYTLPDGSLVQVNLQTASSGRQAPGGGDELMIYKLEGDRKSVRHDAETRSHVWSLAPILDEGQDPKDVLAAIEALLDLQDGEPAPARLRFHRETQLLLARAEERQLGVIDELLRELFEQKSRKEEASGSQREQNLRQALTNERAELKSRLTEYESGFDTLRRAATAAEARAAVLERRLDQLEDELREGFQTRLKLEQRVHLLETADKVR